VTYYGNYYSGYGNVITHNNISSNSEGIFLSGEKNSIIESNLIFGNELGIQVWCSRSYKVLENNMLGNGKDAQIETDIIYYILNSGEGLWNGNYWDEPMQEPVRIPGKCWFIFINMLLVNILGLEKILIFPFYRLDHNPASEPYDI
jgi:parallel beta-helix repeat protein